MTERKNSGLRLRGDSGNRGKVDLSLITLFSRRRFRGYLTFVSLFNLLILDKARYNAEAIGGGQKANE